MVEQEKAGLDVGEGAFGNCLKCNRDYDMDEYLICACPTIEQMIEEMGHLTVSYVNSTWTAIHEWEWIEDGTGDLPFAAIRALYEKWKEGQE